MKCAIVIGVNKVGNLTPLAAAVDGAKKFAAWAESQHYEVISHYDTEGPVRYDEVRASVKKIVESRKYECLVIFFSGHGKWQGPGTETWLLSQAAEEPAQAITVMPSALAAKYSGIPHIAFMSDACRSVITDPQINYVTGASLFSAGNATIETKIDLIFSSRPGDPSYEVRSARDGVAAFGILTECALKGLHGHVPSIFSPFPDKENIQKNVIESEKLFEYLVEAVPEEAHKRNPNLVQVPESWIGSRLPKYLSEFPCSEDQQAPPINTNGAERGWPAAEKNNAILNLTDPLLDDDRVEDKFMNIIFGKKTGFNAREYRRFRNASYFHEYLRPIGTNILVYNSSDQFFSDTSPFRGVNVELSALLNEGAKLYGPLWETGPASPRMIAIHLPSTDKAVYYLPLDNGTIIPLPLLYNFNTTVWMKADKVIHISFRPGYNHRRFGSYDQYRDSIEKRTLLLLKCAHAGNHHLFKVDNGGELLGDYLRRAKAFDPSLGLYAVYAYAQAGRWQDILSVYSYMLEEPEGVLYDVQLFADLADRRDFSDKDQAIFNHSFPALTQGWSYLTEKQTERRPALAELRKYLVPGLWTKFTREALEILPSLK